MGVKVSVIIPVYNAADYLAFCIESVINQTLQEIEIIVINDGSTDGSEAIIQRFAAIDKRIIFIDGENKGVSAARNKGISRASGEFIGFVDADDWVAPEMYESLYLRATKNGADIAVCDANVISEASPATVRLLLEDELIDIAAAPEEAFMGLMHFKYDFANWNKLYTSSIIRQQQLKFDVELTVYEDLFFNLCFFQYAKKLAVIKQPLYNYRIHPSSVMKSGDFNIVAQYSLLFTRFTQFCFSRNKPICLPAFEKDMRRGLYYTVVPKSIRQVLQNESHFIKRIRCFASILARVPPALFNYSSHETAGIRGFKKRLLKNGQYSFFSFLVFFKRIF